MVRRVRTFLAGCLVLLTLAACQADGDPTAQATDQAGGDNTPPRQQLLRWGFDLGNADPDRVLNGFLTWGWNVFDPLVKLDDELRPVPNVAERWELSEDGLALTFRLRRDGRWSNGDPLTAHDYAFAWKYNLADGAPGPAGPFSGIVGADAFAACDPKKDDCDRLWERVGVETPDDYTLVVRFTSPQPFFLSYVGGYACLCFAPLHRETVERYGETWHEAGHIVTSGPFTVAAWEPEESLVLAKDEGWRKADEVDLERIEVSFWREEQAASRAFEAGELDVFFAWSVQASHLEHIPVLASGYAGLNVKRVPDPRQRRAMALAIDREALIERASQGRRTPATSLTARGVPGFEQIAQRFLGSGPRLEEAKRLMRLVEDPVDEITLWLNEERRELAPPVKEAWAELGIDVSLKILGWEEYLQLLNEHEVDAHLLGWVYDFPEAINLLELWRCDHPANATAFCDRDYDRLLDRAAVEQDESARIELYAQAEALLSGPEGAMPVIPLAWDSLPVAAQPSVEGLDFNVMGQIDLTRVRIASG